MEFQLCQHNRNPGVYWERKWKLNHLPLLSRYYLMVARRRMGPRANPYALVRIHATRYVCQHLRATPGCTSRMFPVTTTRVNVRRRQQQHLAGTMYPEKDKQETEKGWVIPTLFTKFKLDKCLFVVSMNTLRPKVAKESTRSTSVEIQKLMCLLL
jgi:hypothetical protein